MIYRDEILTPFVNEEDLPSEEETPETEEAEEETSEEVE